TASHVFGVKPEEVDANLRRHAKAINFGIVYGISAFGLSKSIGVSPAEAKAYIDAYFAQMPEVKTHLEKTIEFAHKNGFVETPFGRHCSVLGINDSNKRVVANAERAAINAPIQGGAADIIKLVMNKIERILSEKNMKTKMLLQVHDELIFETPDDEAEAAKTLVQQEMENIIDCSVKFKAEAGIGTTWTEAH
ncbi:MAG: DNA polymerase, partial [Alphaproteobacteria bacterium]|nr:DNA polymerase [Alphaproteobacteria bacterium]